MPCHGWPKRHVEAEEHPDDQDDGEGREREHHAVHGPPLLHDAAVEHDQAGDAHQADERRGGHLPGVIARVQPGWIWKYGPREQGYLLSERTGYRARGAD